MKRKGAAFLNVLLTLAMVLSVCIMPGAAESGRDDVTIAVVSEWATLDPMIANDLLAFTCTNQFFDTLVLLKQDDNTLFPGLATAWDISGDGLEYTFHLREGVKFHNGETMTADDVVFSFDRAAASTPTARITGAIEKTEKIDDLTVKVTLQYPYGPFLSCVSMPNLAVVSQKAVEEMGDEAFARNPVGTGPYVFVEWKPGDRLIMEAFPDYWRGEAAVKNASFRIITDATTTTIALEKGEIDMIMSVTPSEKQNIVDNANLFYSETSSGSPWFLAFNMEQGLFTDPLLRQAVAHAVNGEDIIIGVLEGNGLPIDAPMTPEAFGYPHGFERTPYDPARAKEILAEAGYPDGLDITLKTIESPNYARPGEILQEQLRVAGFNCRLELMERGAFLSDAYTNGQYELMFTSLTALIPDADMITYTRFHSAYKGNGMNFTYTDIPEMDVLLERSRATTDAAEREQIFRDIYEMNKEVVIYVPLYVGMNGTACVANLKGLAAHMAQRYFIYDLYWE
ncbi:MAG: ABC transporter substrate-binding protein [Clostridia bacterium]|nr:ABC transporter substrate-binding protein [Clostridia bacterium]